MPKHEFGLEVSALVGSRRFRGHRRGPEIRGALGARGVVVAERTVTHRRPRDEELIAVRLADADRLRARWPAQGRGVLALDGLQPDVGHEVLRVLRDGLSGEGLLARSLLGATEAELGRRLDEGRAALPVPIQGVIADGPPASRHAGRTVSPGAPHQLGPGHALREAARPIDEADRHAKPALKQQVRGVRPVERALAGHTDPDATNARASCLAVRRALSDAGRPPLCASGLTLHQRWSAIHAARERLAAKRGSPSRWPAAMRGWRAD